MIPLHPFHSEVEAEQLPNPPIVNQRLSMTDPSNPTGENRAGAVADERYCLKYPNDAGFIPGDHPPDEDSSVSPASASDTESECSGSRVVNLAAASLRLMAESMLGIEWAEMEAAKAREASRLEAERQRAELELELTRMVAHTQLQVATVLAGKSDRGRKRKRRQDGEDTPSALRREKATALLSLLHCNLFL